MYASGSGRPDAPQDGAPAPVEATSDAIGRLISLALLGAALGAALGAPVALQF